MTPEENVEAEQQPPVEEGVKVVDVSKFPALTDFFPPVLDGGRIVNLASPPKWQTVNSDAHLALMVPMPRAPKKATSEDLPRILFIARASNEWKEDVTVDNVEAFRDALGERIAKAKPLESARAIVIGDNAYVRYVLPGKQGKLPLERQILETVFDGRHYTLTLEVSGKEPGGAELKKYRDIAYSIAGTIKYTKPESAPPKAEVKKAE